MCIVPVPRADALFEVTDAMLCAAGPVKTRAATVRGPLRPSPWPVLHGRGDDHVPQVPEFVTNRTADTTGSLLTDFAAAPRRPALPRISSSALRG